MIYHLLEWTVFLFIQFLIKRKMGHWIRDHIENLSRTVNSWGKVGGMGRGKVFGRLRFLGGLLVLRPALDHCATWKLFLVGPYFWPHEFVFFLCSDLDSTLSCQVIRILCLQLLCPSGARLKKNQTNSNPVSSPSKKTGWWKNRSPGCFLNQNLVCFWSFFQTSNFPSSA